MSIAEKLIGKWFAKWYKQNDIQEDGMEISWGTSGKLNNFN